MRDRDQQEGRRNGSRMTDQDGGIQTNVDLAAAGAFLHELTRSFRDRHQTFHQDRDHARQEQHDRGQVHTESKDLHQYGVEVARIVEAQNAKDQTDDQTQDHRFAHHAEALANGFRIRIHFVQPGDPIDQPVCENGKGYPGSGGEMRN